MSGGTGSVMETFVTVRMVEWRDSYWTRELQTEPSGPALPRETDGFLWRDG